MSSHIDKALSVILFRGGGRGASRCIPRIHLPMDAPQDASPSGCNPLDAPPRCTPHMMHLSSGGTPFPSPEDKRSTGGRYASYWNAYLFNVSFQEINGVLEINGQDAGLSRMKFLISFVLKRDIRFTKRTVLNFTDVLMLIISHVYVDVGIETCFWILVVENVAKLMKPMPAG